MLTLSNSLSSEPNIRKHKTPSSPPNSLPRKNSFTSRSRLFIYILCLQILLFIILRSIPLYFLHRRYLENQNHFSLPATVQHLSVPNDTIIDDRCPSGRIFVYDIASSLNTEILKKCHELNPWSSKCDALSNNGFGQIARGLEGIIPENLAPAWYWTDQFALEIIFHKKIMKHKCRTLEADNATAFYIPFYAGLALDKYLWSNSTPKERDHHCEMMLTWLRDQPHFKKAYGWDHFMTMGRITWDFRRTRDDHWGSSCIYLPGMRNVSRLLIERNPWDYFDVGVPYPTGFHPRNDNDVKQWQQFVRNRNRTTLFCFAGASRRSLDNYFRSQLIGQCYNESGSCRVVDCAKTKCSNGAAAILETFLDSEFCLQPRGDSFTRRSIFDCMIAGSVPVLFWKRTAYYQYEWFLPGEQESYSVYIDSNAVKNGTSIKEVLESFSKEEVQKMREKVIEYIPKFIYARPTEGLESIKDAFDVAIEGVLNRIKEQETWDYKW